VLFLFLIIVTYVPAISTTIPNAVMGPQVNCESGTPANQLEAAFCEARGFTTE
jgi:C4-dicarboxylate transporter DctM subunit